MIEPDDSDHVFSILMVQKNVNLFTLDSHPQDMQPCCDTHKA